MKTFKGTVNMNHFGSFYRIIVDYADRWIIGESTDGVVHFEVFVSNDKAKKFKALICVLTPGVEMENPTLFEKIVNFFTKKKGNSCEQCC